MSKFIKRLSLGVLILAVLGIAFGQGYRAYRQHQLGEMLVIDTPDGIDERRFVEANGIEHWVTIRGEDRHNPILFFLHGGPGETVSYAPAATQSWEKDFVVVHWDQRGAGRTYGRNMKPPAGLNLEQMTDDGVEVARWVIQYLGQRQVILVGHSWGSILGVHMLFAESDLFSTYVGTGQFVSWRDQTEAQYQYVLNRASAEDDSEVSAALAEFGEPPAREMDRYLAFRSLFLPYLAPADIEFASSQLTELLVRPRASLIDIWNAIRGARASLDALGGTLLGADLRELGTDLPVPFVLIQGDDDRITPTALALDYFEGIRAPAKAAVRIPGAGHYSFVTRGFPCVPRRCGLELRFRRRRSRRGLVALSRPGAARGVHVTSSAVL